MKETLCNSEYLQENKPAITLETKSRAGGLGRGACGMRILRDRQLGARAHPGQHLFLSSSLRKDC